MIANISGAIIFEKVLPVVWLDTPMFVQSAIKIYEVEVAYTNPCPMLRKPTTTGLPPTIDDTNRVAQCDIYFAKWEDAMDDVRHHQIKRSDTEDLEVKESIIEEHFAELKQEKDEIKLAQMTNLKYPRRGDYILIEDYIQALKQYQVLKNKVIS